MEDVNHHTSHQFLILSIQNSAFSTVNAIEHSAIMTINDKYKRIWKEVVTSHMNVPDSHSSGMNNMYAIKKISIRYQVNASQHQSWI
jgi:hypothetical protein